MASDSLSQGARAHKAVGVLGLVSVLAATACGGSPTSPALKSPGTDLFASAHADPDFQHRLAQGGGVTYFVDPMYSNLRCTASTGDPVTTGYGFEDFSLYASYFTFVPETLGAVTISCTADPNARGSLGYLVTPPPVNVTVWYVRAGTPGPQQVDPTKGGRIEALSGFVTSNGAARVQQACEGMHLTWDPASLTLGCSIPFADETAVNDLTAACATDPASASTRFTGGSIFVNGTLLTTRWSGSTSSHQCWLFTVDSGGVVRPPASGGLPF
jgi:hypothetical protein